VPDGFEVGKAHDLRPLARVVLQLESPDVQGQGAVEARRPGPPARGARHEGLGHVGGRFPTVEGVAEVGEPRRHLGEDQPVAPEDDAGHAVGHPLGEAVEEVCVDATA